MYRASAKAEGILPIPDELPVACWVARFPAARRGWGRQVVLTRARSILVYDRTGDVFDRLRRTGIGSPLWRVSALPADRDLDRVDLAVVALYERSDWTAVGSLVRRIPTVVVAGVPDPGGAARALASGAFGYLEVGFSSRALRRAIVGAIRGEPAYSRAILGDRIRAEIGTTGARAARAFALTPRQREVVALIATGASDKEIGTALGIATGTAQKHVTRVLKRLDVPNRAAAVAATLV